MGAIVETLIDRFDGGIVNDPRDKRENTSRVVTNFDALTNSWKMTPYRDSEDGHDNASTEKIQNFGIGLRTGTTYSLYGLGITSGGGVAEIYYKDLTTGSANDLDDNAWAETSNNKDGSGTTEFDLFIYYAKTGKFYGAAAGTRIWSYEADGGAFVASADTFNYTNVAQGIVHSADDILYVPYDNKIAVNNNDSWNDTGITLPAQFKITSLAEYGNFLAIACAPLSGFGNSRVFLWDRDTSLSTVSESIDWGEGVLKIIDVIDGTLIGISQVGGLGVATTQFFNNRAIFRFYDLAKGAVQFKEMIADDTNLLVRISKQKIDNQLFFLMSINLNGATREGLWSIGRNDVNGELALVHERTPNNDTALVTSSDLDGFIIVGDFTFITYTTSGAFAMSKTNDSANYTATSIYESKVFNSGEKGIAGSSQKKDLVGITITTEPLPTSGQVVLKYAVDENIGTDTFTTISTNTTDNSISNSDVTSLPKDYKEIQFRLESTGNAEITALNFLEEVTDKRAYS